MRDAPVRVMAQQGDSVDSLCHRHLGNSAAVEATLELNPGLAALGPVLPLGTFVLLPPAPLAVPASNIINLWD